MKRILLLAATLAGFLATACAPLVSAGHGVATAAVQATLTTDGTAVTFINLSADVAQDVSITLYGPAAVADPRCMKFSRSWICAVGDVAQSVPVKLAYTGLLNDALGSFYRDKTGNVPLPVKLK